MTPLQKRIEEYKKKTLARNMGPTGALSLAFPQKKYPSLSSALSTPNNLPSLKTQGTTEQKSDVPHMMGVLSVPDYVSGEIAQAPARGIAALLRAKQPKVRPFSEMAIESVSHSGLPTPVAQGLGIAVGIIGDPLNVVGGGAKGAKLLIETLTNLKSVPEVSSVLKSAGFADDIIRDYAPIIAKETNPQAIEKALLAAQKLQNTTKISGKVAGAPSETFGLSEKVLKRFEGKTSISREAIESLVEDPSFKQSEKDLIRRVLGESGTGGTLNTLDQIKSKYPNLELSVHDGNEINLSKIVVPKDARGSGLGTAFMNDLADYADLVGKRIVLTPTKDFGASSVSRLTDFYKRFGFKENKGRNRDFSTRESMIREPVVKGNDPTLTIKNQSKSSDQISVPDFANKLKRLEGRVPTPRATTLARQEGLARGRNIGEQKLSNAVRTEQLKGLKGGIKMRLKLEDAIQLLRSSNKSVEDIKKVLTDHIKDALKPSERGKALVLLRDAKTREDLVRAYARINLWAEKALKVELRDEIVKINSRIMESPSVALDYKQKVQSLLKDIEFKKHSERKIEDLRRVEKFLQQELAQGKDVEISSKMLKMIAVLHRTPIEEISISQMRGIKQELETLEALGRVKLTTQKNLDILRKEKEINAIRSQGAPQITKSPILRPTPGERLTFTKKFSNKVAEVKNSASRLDKYLSPIDVIFDLLDGSPGTYNGANYRIFKATVDAAYGAYISRRNAIWKNIDDLVLKYGLDAASLEKMGAVAAREQDGGLQKLIDNGYTKEEILNLSLSKEEQHVLDEMRKVFEEEYPAVADTMRRVYNTPVGKVKNYFPWMTDWKALSESEIHERLGEGAEAAAFAKRKNVNVDFTKQRFGGQQRIKLNALDIFHNHTDNVSYLLEMGATSKRLGELASSPAYRDAVGEAGQLLVREWIDVIARKGGVSGIKQIEILDTLRKNTSAALLGLKLSSVAIQPTSLIDGAGFIGAKYIQSGVQNFTTSKEWRNFVAQMPEISDRIGGEYALRELTDDDLWSKIQRMGFVPLQMLDQFTAGMVAAGAYERKMVELGRRIDLTKMDPEALAYAQLAVRRTQSSGSFKDVPLAVSRGAMTGNVSLDRAILQFQNFLLTRWSRIRHDAIRVGIAQNDPKKAAPILASLIVASLAASGIRLGTTSLTNFIAGKESDKEADEQLIKNFLFEVTGSVPFVGNMTSMALYDGEMFPVLDAPVGVLSGLMRMLSSSSEEAQLRGLNELVFSTTALLGAPGSAQAEQIGRNFLRDAKKRRKKKSSSSTGGARKRIAEPD